MTVLFDSNILIDYLNNAGRARNIIDEQSVRPAISIVTLIETLAGAVPDTAEAVARRFMGRFRVLPLTDEIAEETVRIRRSTRLKLPDAIILATARVHGLTLVTRNTKDFPTGDPAIHVPYEL